MRFPTGIAALAAATLPLAAAAEVPAIPAATVTANAVAHAGEGITVRVPATATYVGSDRFELYGVADAEVHVFVEANADQRMRRLWWVQFESYLPSNEHSYNYADGNRKIDLGGGPRPGWWRNRGARPPRPARDRTGSMFSAF